MLMHVTPVAPQWSETLTCMIGHSDQKEKWNFFAVNRPSWWNVIFFSLLAGLVLTFLPCFAPDNPPDVDACDTCGSSVFWNINYTIEVEGYSQICDRKIYLYSCFWTWFLSSSVKGNSLVKWKCYLHFCLIQPFGRSGVIIWDLNFWDVSLARGLVINPIFI